MIRYTYLLVDILSLLVPLIASFHPKINFYRYWLSVWPAILFTGLFYALWDSWFVHLGLWGFNAAYLTGPCIGNLPIEEILFFVCIPYSCVFTFYCLSKFTGGNFMNRTTPYINYILLLGLIICLFIFRGKPYTNSSCLLLAILVFIGIIKKPYWFPQFYLAYALLIIPFLVVNGILTGTGLHDPVVWYNSGGIIGLRIFTIPVEDFIYGMGLILLNVWTTLWIQSRAFSKKFC